jgi:hypothetical protein
VIKVNIYQLHAPEYNLGVPVSSKDKLFALINATNPLPRPLTANNVELIDPRPAVGTDWNTRVTIRAITDKGYSREQDVFYRRIDLSDLEPIVYKASDVTTPASLLALINARRGTWMELEDVQPFVVPVTPAGGQSSVVITAADESYCFIGQATVTLRKAAPVPVANVTLGARTTTEDPAWPFLQRFTVTLSEATTNPVSVGIRTDDGGSGAGESAYDSRLELLQFAPGETVKHLDVRTTVNRSGVEIPYSVLLSDPTGCTIGTASVGAVLPNQTQLARLTVLEAEDLGPELNQVRFRVSLEREYAAVIDALYGTVDGTALDGTDYLGTSGVWHFLMGETEKEVVLDYVRPPAGSVRSFSFGLTDANLAVIEVASAIFTIPEAEEVALPALTVGDATFTAIPPPVEFAVEVTGVLMNTHDVPSAPYTDGRGVWEERGGVEVVFTLTRELLPTEHLVLTSKRYVEDSFDPVADIDIVMNPGGLGGRLSDTNYYSQGPSYSLNSNGELFYVVEVRDDTDALVVASQQLQLLLLPEDPVTREIFRDDFNGTEDLTGHAPNVNALIDPPWLEGVNTSSNAWRAGDLPPLSTVSGGRLTMGSASDAATILYPGDDLDPAEATRVRSYTVDFVWRSPRSSEQDRLLNDAGYPLQLSVGKSDITWVEDGFRQTIGFTINANDGVSEKTISFYGDTPVPVSYEADTNYTGTLVVSPKGRYLNFLGVELQTGAGLAAEDKRQLIVGPLYLHAGENCQLDFIRIRTGQHVPAIA